MVNTINLYHGDATPDGSATRWCSPADIRKVVRLREAGSALVKPRPTNLSSVIGILLGGIAKPLWTYTRFLTARPIRDIYGIVETPDTAGLIDPGDAAGVRSALNERSQGGMP